jgi:hypothetical protein
VSVDLAAVRADDFQPHVESTFAAQPASGGPFTLTLVDVCRGAATRSREQFTLTFVGGPNPPVQQGILHLEHDVLGTLDLFVVPIGPGVDGRHRYEAVFA